MNKPKGWYEYREMPKTNVITICMNKSCNLQKITMVLLIKLQLFGDYLSDL